MLKSLCIVLLGDDELFGVWGESNAGRNVSKGTRELYKSKIYSLQWEFTIQRSSWALCCDQPNTYLLVSEQVNFETVQVSQEELLDDISESFRLSALRDITTKNADLEDKLETTASKLTFVEGQLETQSEELLSLKTRYMLRNYFCCCCHMRIYACARAFLCFSDRKSLALNAELVGQLVLVGRSIAFVLPGQA